MVLRRLKERRRFPHQGLRPIGSGDSPRVAVRMKARLELADPVPTCAERQTRVCFETLLKSALGELFISET